SLSRLSYASRSALFETEWKTVRTIDELSKAFVACVVVTPAIIRRVIEAQFTEQQCMNKVMELASGEVPFYTVSSDGGLRYKGRLVVPPKDDLRREVMSEAHSSQFSVHPGGDKMYQDMKRQFWWAGMKRDIAIFVSKCSTCQMIKIDHQRPPGALQPLPIPEWKWESISM